MLTPRKIVSSRLTTCEVDQGGEVIRLSFLDEAGAPVSIELPFEHAESIAMTLPRLLSNALKTRMNTAKARYVFPLGRWAVEDSDDTECLIVTLTTTDGFEASYGVPFQACRAIGWVLSREGNDTIEGDDDAPEIVPLN